MLVPLKITTDYSLLKSTIKISQLVSFLQANSITTCAICDDNLYGVMDFYNALMKAQIKPIIGLNVNIQNNDIYLYAKNYAG